jgi:hypothetical protein
MMQKEQWFYKVQPRQRMRLSGRTEPDAPFGDHVGPAVQFTGAFCGQVPAKSLETTYGEKYGSLCD